MDKVFKYISAENLEIIKNIAITLAIGYVVIQVLVIISKRIMWKGLSQQSKLLVNKVIIYLGVIIVLFTVLKHLGISLTTLLSAAGIMTVVIGFASQTSISNVISGIFIISEKSFEIGDLIRVGDKLGVVYSIDLLSIKLKTLENLLIRIPNQTMLSTEVTNITKFPIRRMDISVSVAYKEDLTKVMEVLKCIAKETPLCLDEPEPLIVIKEFASSSIDILYGLWFEKSNYVGLKNSIMVNIKEAFDSEGIEIPFPHISVYAGEATKPFSVVSQ